MNNIDIDKFLLEQIKNNKLNPYSEITKNMSFNQTIKYIETNVKFINESDLIEKLKEIKILK